MGGCPAPEQKAPQGDCPSVLGLSPTRMVLSVITSRLRQSAGTLSAVRRQGGCAERGEI